MERDPHDVRVGQAIQHARERQHLTRADVAVLVECTYQHVANVERGQKHCSPQLLAQIAEAVDVTTEALTREAPT
jgi:transcriptional regulator with XRE-family HTH domain